MVGAEDVLGQFSMQLNLAIGPLCSPLEPNGHAGTHCWSAVGATVDQALCGIVIAVD